MVKIYITQTSCGSRGPIYRVELEGEVLIEGTHIPFYDGARALAAKDLAGDFEMWDCVRAYPRMKGIIEQAAMLTVSEGEDRPRVRKWTPRDYNTVF